MKRLSALLIATLALLVGCSGQPIEPSYYLLRTTSDLESRTLEPSKEYSLGGIVIASYLDQTGMMLETTDGEIRPARHHRWAEPVYDAVHGFLLVELGRLYGEDIFPNRVKKAPTTIEVRINQLHGTADGEAKLVAYWWLRKGGDVIAAYQFAESQTQDSDGYGALARAERQLLRRLASDIADSLKANRDLAAASAAEANDEGES